MTRRTHIIILALLLLAVILLAKGGEQVAGWLSESPGGEYTPQPELWRLSVG